MYETAEEIPVDSHFEGLTIKSHKKNKKKVKHTATAEDSLVALSHRILRWARFVWVPSHQLRTH